jgi:hypothetical protein
VVSSDYGAPQGPTNYRRSSDSSGSPAQSVPESEIARKKPIISAKNGNGVKVA